MFSSKIQKRPFELRRTASLRTVVTEAPENSSSCEFRLTHCGLGLETFLAFSPYLTAADVGHRGLWGQVAYPLCIRLSRSFLSLGFVQLPLLQPHPHGAGPEFMTHRPYLLQRELQRPKGNGRIYLFDTDLLTLRVRKENLLSSRQKATASQSMVGTEMKPPGYKY